MRTGLPWFTVTGSRSPPTLVVGLHQVGVGSSYVGLHVAEAVVGLFSSEGGTWGTQAVRTSAHCCIATEWQPSGIIHGPCLLRLACRRGS